MEISPCGIHQAAIRFSFRLPGMSSTACRARTASRAGYPSTAASKTASTAGNQVTDRSGQVSRTRDELRGAEAADELFVIIPGRGDHPQPAHSREFHTEGTEPARGPGHQDGLAGRFAEQDVNLRWIYVHLIEEYARHNGHADLLRERIDGATGV
jgi:Protein of unknown function (DUF664)